MSNPTPLRELLTEARREFRDSDAAGDVLDWLEERATLAGASFDVELVADMLRRYSAIVTSDGFDAAGHYTDACIGEQIDALESSEAGAETVALATPPASGEADPQNWPQWVKDAVRNANEAGRHAGRAEATPSAASGDVEKAIRGVAQWLLHRFGPNTPEANEATALHAAADRLAAVAPAGMDGVVAYFAESDREAYVFHANDGESLDAYTADGFTVTPLVRSTRAQPDSVMPAEVVQQQASLYNPATQVFFRAGLIACREYMARFVQVESPSIAASIRANWWPNLGQDFGPPRKIDWNELTEGEFGTPSFRVKPAGEVSPTLEALPIALGFLELCAAPTPPATAGQE